MLQIFVFLGKSSVGKSLLFESVVLATGHQIISSTSNHSGDAGVGRFQTGSKNTVSINTLNTIITNKKQIHSQKCSFLGCVSRHQYCYSGRRGC